MNDEPNAAHFRIVIPEHMRGRKHAGQAARVFITLPGMEEVPCPGTTNVQAEWPVDGAVRVDVSFVATIEVEYV